MPKAGYRAIFAAKLRQAWQMARAVYASAAFEASLLPVAEATLSRGRRHLRRRTCRCFTAAGDARMVAQLAAASAMIEAASYGAAL